MENQTKDLENDEKLRAMRRQRLRTQLENEKKQQQQLRDLWKYLFILLGITLLVMIINI